MRICGITKWYASRKIGWTANGWSKHLPVIIIHRLGCCRVMNIIKTKRSARRRRDNIVTYVLLRIDDLKKQYGNQRGNTIPVPSQKKKFGIITQDREGRWVSVYG